DEETLDLLEELTAVRAEYARGEQVLTASLSQTLDGPATRSLLARRGQMREERLNDRAGAAEDLRRLHELSPSDEGVSDRLGRLYELLGDYSGMVHLYEDQILRGRDQNKRGELARKVARLWQDRLRDPRESAAAWRRVLRLNSGDDEAKTGLARAKDEMHGNHAMEAATEAESERLRLAGAARLTAAAETRTASTERLSALPREAAPAAKSVGPASVGSEYAQQEAATDNPPDSASDPVPHGTEFGDAERFSQTEQLDMAAELGLEVTAVPLESLGSAVTGGAERLSEPGAPSTLLREVDDELPTIRPQAAVEAEPRRASSRPAGKKRRKKKRQGRN
ncbi:MAG: hypothetical protein RJA70_3960, partial [Pseudomonadota bacterium]